MLTEMRTDTTCNLRLGAHDLILAIFLCSSFARFEELFLFE